MRLNGPSYAACDAMNLRSDIFLITWRFVLKPWKYCDCGALSFSSCIFIFTTGLTIMGSHFQ